MNTQTNDSTITKNPYQSLPPKSFWRTAVADKNMFEISELWKPKFNINKNHKVITFGSCFAQHIGKALKNNGYKWLCTENAPYGLSNEDKKKFNYEIFSCRTGNIYTTSLLKQWLDWIVEEKKVPGEVWCNNGRFYDPFRPNIEPSGFESEEELIQSRNTTIKSFRKAIEEANLFVFTLGLTESWVNTEHGYEYPMCPGTVAGEFDSNFHKFENQEFSRVVRNLLDSIAIIRTLNPKIRFILTVSPVPLTATKSGEHVIVATSYSKSVLRAVAGQISSRKKFVDYFPSYEIINSPPYKGSFFEPNQRSVSSAGVDFVMKNFFECLNSPVSSSVFTKNSRATKEIDKSKATSSEVCEEALLDAFSKKD